MTENRSELTIGLHKMNRYETDTPGVLVNTAPLFASVWLALFCTLRQNYYERRLAATADTNRAQAMKSK
jgi:hypothetical protein